MGYDEQKAFIDNAISIAKQSQAKRINDHLESIESMNKASNDFIEAVRSNLATYKSLYSLGADVRMDVAALLSKVLSAVSKPPQTDDEFNKALEVYRVLMYNSVYNKDYEERFIKLRKIEVENYKRLKFLMEEIQLIL